MQYQQDEKVLCYHGPLLYQAKAEDWKGDENQSGATGPHYFVHYQGWKKTWDEWVPPPRLLKFNDENIALQKSLVASQKAEAEALAQASSQASDANAQRRAEPRKPGAAPGSHARGTKRVRDSADHEEGERRPDIKLQLPDSLRLQLVDDWENVTRKEELVPLPRTPNVRTILKEYADHYDTRTSAKTRHDRLPAVMSEVLQGLQLYFNKSLPQNLLYRFERTQYVELRKKLGSRLNVNERGSGTGASAGDTSAGGDTLAPCDIYGAEHLLRLFGTYGPVLTSVNLPSIVAHTNMDNESVALLHDHVTDLLAYVQNTTHTSYMAKEKARLFLREYETPSTAYLRLSGL